LTLVGRRKPCIIYAIPVLLLEKIASSPPRVPREASGSPGPIGLSVFSGSGWRDEQGGPDLHVQRSRRVLCLLPLPIQVSDELSSANIKEPIKHSNRLEARRSIRDREIEMAVGIMVKYGVSREAHTTSTTL
jgi:hypothetical protein